MSKCQKCKFKEENEALKMEIAGIEAALKMISKTAAAKRKPNPDYVPPPSIKKSNVDKCFDKLKPCPFCGGEAVLYHQSSKYTDHDGNYVHCIKCGARTKLFECFNGTGKTHDDTKKEAITSWNKRSNENEH